MKSALIFVSSFFLVAAVHGSALLETRVDNEIKRDDSQNPQGGNGTFIVPSNCSAPLPATQGTGQPIPVTPATNQSSDGTPPSQGPPPKCFNLTDPSGSQPSVVVQFNNNTSPAQDSQPPSNQTAPPDGDNNSLPSDPHFQFCPNSDGEGQPFTNGTSINFQEVPCPGVDNGTSQGGDKGDKPKN